MLLVIGGFKVDGFFLSSVKHSSILIRYPGRQKGSRLVAEGWI